MPLSWRVIHAGPGWDLPPILLMRDASHRLWMPQPGLMPGMAQKLQLQKAVWMSSPRNIAFLSESEAEQELFSSFIAVMGERTGCRWSCSPDLGADVVVIDTDNFQFFERFRKHTRAVLVGFGQIERGGTHYHLQRPLRMAQLTTLLADIVRDGLGARDEVVLRYMAEMSHPHVAMDVVVEMVQRLSSGQIDKETVARHMGISASTLQRRLAAEGASFRQLLNNTRRDLAERYLQESQRPIKDVAYSLGFADLSNFTRAFRSWFGVSPREFRNNNRKSL